MVEEKKNGDIEGESRETMNISQCEAKMQCPIACLLDSRTHVLGDDNTREWREKV